MADLFLMFSQFDEEIEGVKEYLKCASEAGDDVELATSYTNMAKAEFEHAKTLNGLISKKLKKEMDPEEAKDMLSGYLKDMHLKAGEELAKAKILLETAK